MECFYGLFFLDLYFFWLCSLFLGRRNPFFLVSIPMVSILLDDVVENVECSEPTISWIP